MERDLQALHDRIERLLGGVDRLVDENIRLKAELASAHAARVQVEQRIQDARARVESALARLPLEPDTSPDTGA